MNTPLLDEIRTHLATITAEQFQAEWAEIEAKNLQGPSIEDFLKSLAYTPIISEISLLETIASAQFSDEFSSLSSGNTTYAMAA